MKRLHLLTSAVAVLLAGSLVAPLPALARGHWDGDDDRGWAPPAPPAPWASSHRRHHHHHRHHRYDDRPPRVIYRERRVYEPVYDEPDNGLTIIYKGVFR